MFNCTGLLINDKEHYDTRAIALKFDLKEPGTGSTNHRHSPNRSKKTEISCISSNFGAENALLGLSNASYASELSSRAWNGACERLFSISALLSGKSAGLSTCRPIHLPMNLSGAAIALPLFCSSILHREAFVCMSNVNQCCLK